MRYSYTLDMFSFLPKTGGWFTSVPKDSEWKIIKFKPGIFKCIWISPFGRKLTSNKFMNIVYPKDYKSIKYL